MKGIIVYVTSVLLMKTMAVVHRRGVRKGEAGTIVYIISSASPHALLTTD